MAGKEGKKGRKVGRNKDFCNMYKSQKRREKNKRIKLDRHLKIHPNDHQAKEARNNA